jgi:WD40 repeat protein
MRHFQGQRQPVKALAFAPDGRHLAAKDGRSGFVVYDTIVGQLVHRIPSAGESPDYLVFLPDGRLITAAACDMKVYVSPLTNGGHVGFYPHQVKLPVASLATAAKGNRLVVTATHLHCWQMTDHVPKPAWFVEAEAPRMFWALAVAPNGDRLAVTTAPWSRPAELALYDAATGGRIATLVPDNFLCGGPLDWSPDGAVLAAVADHELSVYDATGGHQLWQARTGSRRVFTSLAFHPSGQSLLVGCSDGTARLYDPATGREICSFAWRINKVRSVAFSLDGRLAAVGGEKGEVVVWDLADR